MATLLDEATATVGTDARDGLHLLACTIRSVKRPHDFDKCVSEKLGTKWGKRIFHFMHGDHIGLESRVGRIDGSAGHSRHRSAGVRRSREQRETSEDREPDCRKHAHGAISHPVLETEREFGRIPGEGLSALLRRFRAGSGRMRYAAQFCLGGRGSGTAERR